MVLRAHVKSRPVSCRSQAICLTVESKRYNNIERGAYMNAPKPSVLLSGAAWICVFGTGMLVVARKIPSDFLTWGMFVFFFLVALMATAVSTPRVKK